jgi:subtilisin family serine protease
MRAKPDIRSCALLALAFSTACQSGDPEASGDLASVEQEVLEQTSSGGTVDVIVTLKGDAALADLELGLDRRAKLVQAVTERAFTALGPDRARVRWHGKFVPELSLRVDQGLVSKLAGLPMVESVVIDRKVHTMLAQGAPLIGADTTWLAGVTGVGQTVAVLDTGIDYTHPALGSAFGGKVVAGYDFVNEDTDPMDDQGHGTGVAGIVASADAARRGIAPDARLVALKVLGANGEGSWTAIDRAFEWILTNAATYDISVANLSLGTDSVYDDAALCDATNTSVLMGLLRAQGISVFVASGNSGCGTGVSFPACSSNAIAVGAVYDATLGSRAFLTANGCGPSLCQGSPSAVECCADASTSAGKVTCYSNSSSLLDLLAPSHDAVTTQLGGGFQTQFGGTSAATPYAAGAAALLLDLTNGSASAETIQNRLASTGTLRTDPKNQLAFPLINVFQAARSLKFCFGQADGTPCDDEDACTDGDTCVQGECQQGNSADCDDDNPCTDDSCDSELGCVSEPNEAPCSDGSACTENDVCAQGSCVPGPAVVCPDDQNACTTKVCDASSGCGQLPDDALCDDDNPCTDDTCGAAGCEHTPNSDSCDDGVACTKEDQCNGGHCAGTASTCDDDNPCTDDSCDAESGQCQVAAVPAWSACGTGQACFAGQCEPTPAGDRCDQAVALSMGVAYEGDLAGHHEFTPFDPACTGAEALHGAGAFHAIALEPGEYDVILATSEPALDLAFAIKTSCDAIDCTALTNATLQGTESLSAFAIGAASTLVIEVKALSAIADAAPYTLLVTPSNYGGGGEGGEAGNGGEAGEGGEAVAAGGGADEGGLAGGEAGAPSMSAGGQAGAPENVGGTDHPPLAGSGGAGEDPLPKSAARDGGCGCRTAASASTPWALACLPLALLLRRRQRHDTRRTPTH